jgi:hypothetical protein
MKMVLHILAWVVLLLSLVNAYFANFMSGDVMGTEMGIWSLFVVMAGIWITAKTCACPGCACNGMSCKCSVDMKEKKM